MTPGTILRDYRKARRVKQVELAVELGHTNACHVSRMESRTLTDLEFTEAIAAVERVLHRNGADAIRPSAAIAGGDAA